MVPREQIEAHINSFVTNQQQLWREYDEAQQNVITFQMLSRDFVPDSTTPIMEDVTSESTPPAELAAVIPPLHEIVTRIQAAIETIDQHTQEIERIKTNRRVVTIMVTTVLVILFISLAFFLWQASHG